MVPKPGKTITDKRVFTQEDFNLFARLSGDDNPIHVDPDFAANTKFGATVAHGMLLYGIICGVLNEAFPGSAQIDQRMMFTAPTFTGEEITTTIEVIDVDTAGSQFTASVTMKGLGDKTVCDGETTMQWRGS